MTKTYTKPSGAMIRARDQRRLYSLENKRDQAFEASSRHLGEVMGHDSGDYWTRTLPEALYTVLDAYDREAVKLAVLLWLERNPDSTASIGVTLGATLDESPPDGI